MNRQRQGIGWGQPRELSSAGCSIAIAILPLLRPAVWRWRGFFRRRAGGRCRSDRLLLRYPTLATRAKASRGWVTRIKYNRRSFGCGRPQRGRPSLRRTFGDEIRGIPPIPQSARNGWGTELFGRSKLVGHGAAGGERGLEHFRIYCRPACPIHSAFSSGMGGIPITLESTQFRKMQLEARISPGKRPSRQECALTRIAFVKMSAADARAASEGWRRQQEAQVICRHTYPATSTPRAA